ncbi:bolA-like protein 3 isoform X2 [Apostichopus japonicus]|uniref:bolA-like protein 3 isoform X2 n=1 Tax=Stichopus japonicus TaxID=307972 RepID=UPI003AB2D4A2
MLRQFFQKSVPLLRSRWLSANTNGAEGELKLTKILKERFPNAVTINVEDISGGCGAMFQVNIESSDFNGKRLVAQHRMVTEALAEEVKQMHGLRISTTVPSESNKG